MWLAIRIMALVVISTLIVIGLFWLADQNSQDRSESNRSTLQNQDNRIDRNSRKINGTLRCLSTAMDPQSCIERVRGAQGPGGATGRRGGRGVQGQRGERGATGARGSRGLQGLTQRGRTGARGLQGPQGARGPQGLRGIPGLDGINGMPGADAPPPAPLPPCSAQPAELGYQCVTPPGQPVPDGEPPS